METQSQDENSQPQDTNEETIDDTNNNQINLALVAADYACTRSFGMPTVVGYLKDKKKSEKYTGYDLEYASQETKKDSDVPLTIVKLRIRCDAEDDSTEIKWRISSTSENNLIFDYTGQSGCPVLDVSMVKKIQDFSGPVCLIIGILLTFIGSKFIILTFCLLIFLAVVLLVVVAAINFHVIQLDGTDDATAYIVGTIIFGVILGILVSVFVAKFAKKYAVAVLAAWSGATITMMILSPIKMNNMIKLLIILVVAGASIFVGYKFNRKIKALGTSIIGSGILMFGIGSYAGGFPMLIKFTEKDIEEFSDVNYAYIGYIAGFIITSTIGVLFQLKYIDQIDEDEFDMLKWEDK